MAGSSARVLGAVLAVSAALLLVPTASAATESASGPHISHASHVSRGRATATVLIPSIFEAGSPQLAGAGWQTCPTPITWTVDTQALPASQAAAQVDNLAWAFEQWTRATGLVFAYGGQQSLRYDSSAQRISPADGSAALQRHIYVAFASPSDEKGFSGTVDGLATPSLVMPATREIVQGQVLLRSDFFAALGSHVDLARAMDIHEIGHVLGLAHSPTSSDIMFPSIARQVRPSAVDVASARRLVQPCSA